jgi:hypothetical protein
LESSHEPAPVQFSEQFVTDAAAGSVTPEPKPPRDAAERIASGLARVVEGVLNTLPERADELAGWVDELVGGLARAVGGMLGPEAPSPLVPPEAPAPAAPPPAVPIPVGQSSGAGGYIPGGSVFSFDGASGKLLQQIGVLDVLSMPLLHDAERPSTSRELLTPNSAPRPPNDRPG